MTVTMNEGQGHLNCYQQLSCNVTLNQGQCHTDKYENVEFSSIYHHTKLESNQYINVQMQGHVSVFTLPCKKLSFPMIK